MQPLKRAVNLSRLQFNSRVFFLPFIVHPSLPFFAPLLQSVLCPPSLFTFSGSEKRQEHRRASHTDTETGSGGPSFYYQVESRTGPEMCSCIGGRGLSEGQHREDSAAVCVVSDFFAHPLLRFFPLFSLFSLSCL